MIIRHVQPPIFRSMLFLIMAGLPSILIGCTAQTLHDAAKDDNPKRIDELLIAGQDVNGRDAEDYTPLHWAAFFGKVDAAKELVAKGANVEAAESNGMTPLMVAVYYKQIYVAALLITKGAKMDTTDIRKWNILDYAAWNSDVDMAKMLVNAGVPIKPKSPDEPNPLQVARKYGNGAIQQFFIDNGAKY